MVYLAQPIYLLLLLSLPLLGWWWRRSRPRGVPHPCLGLFEGLPVGRAPWAEYGGLALRLVGLALLVLGLARPRWPDLRTRLETEGIGLLLLVDVSGSMGERDFDWNGETITRLEAVKRVFHWFVWGEDGSISAPDGLSMGFEGRPQDLIGLVCFATRPEATCPLTLQHRTLLHLLDAEQPRGVPGEAETNLSDALALGLTRLRAAGSRRQVLVLLSDGEHNQSQTRSGWTPRQAAQVAASLGIPIYALDAGTLGTTSEDAESRERVQVREQAKEALQEIARITSGAYFAVRDTKALLNACRQIDQLERRPITSFQYRRYHEAYPWLGLASFVLLVTAMVLEQTMWRRLP